MKHFKWVILFFVLFVCVFNVAAEDKTVVLSSSEYVPYFGKNLKNQGVITEIITTAFKRMGYEVRIDFFPWARAEYLAKIGKYHGMFALWHRREREQWFIYSEPIPPPNELVYYKKKDRQISYKSVDDLKDLVIGYVYGYSYPSDFAKANLRKHKSYTDEENIRKLISGHIDLAITDKLQAKYLISNRHDNLSPLFNSLTPPLRIDQQYLVISKKIPNHQKIIINFNQGLKQIMEEGTVEKIRKKHGF